jgi:hemoglobin
MTNATKTFMTATKSRFASALMALALVALTGAWMAASSPASAEEKSLYDRIGGYKAVAATVDDLVDRIYVNGTLNKNPILKSIHDLNERAAFKLILGTWVIENTGGPKVYFGRTMKDGHSALNITNLEFDVILHECKETFYKFAVPAQEMGELMAALEGLRKDIVTK